MVCVRSKRKSFASLHGLTYRSMFSSLLIPLIAGSDCTHMTSFLVCVHQKSNLKDMLENGGATKESSTILESSHPEGAHTHTSRLNLSLQLSLSTWNNPLFLISIPGKPSSFSYNRHANPSACPHNAIAMS